MQQMIYNYNNNNDTNSDNHTTTDNNHNQIQTLSSSLATSFFSPSLSPESTWNLAMINNSLNRYPTFSYTPIHTRRKSSNRSSFSIKTFSFSPISPSMVVSSSDLLSSSSSSIKTNNSSVQTPDEHEIPSSPASIFSSTDPMEYTSFPNFDKFADESWSNNNGKNLHDLEMESYDEMFVNGIRFQY